MTWTVWDPAQKVSLYVTCDNLSCPTSSAAYVMVGTAPCLQHQTRNKNMLPELNLQLVQAFLPPDQPVCLLSRPALQS